jgi:chromate transporter
MLLPGPEAMQLAVYAGWLLHGVRGGLVAGLLFVLPGALIITILSAVYVTVGEVPLVQGLLFGLKAAVLAVVLEALIRMSKRALKSGFMAALAASAFVAIALLKLPFPLIIAMAAIGGGLAHALGYRMKTNANGSGEPSEQPICPNGPGPARGASFPRSPSAGGLVRAAPCVRASLGSDHVLVAEASFFKDGDCGPLRRRYCLLVAQQAVEGTAGCARRC